MKADIDMTFSIESSDRSPKISEPHRNTVIKSNLLYLCNEKNTIEHKNQKYTFTLILSFMLENTVEYYET